LDPADRRCHQRPAGKDPEKTSDIPGTEISVEREANGPPTGKPVSLEIAGEDFATLLRLEKDLRQGIRQNGIQGIEDLKSDLGAEQARDYRQHR
jgi:hypothetical protein